LLLGLRAPKQNCHLFVPSLLLIDFDDSTAPVAQRLLAQGLQELLLLEFPAGSSLFPVDTQEYITNTKWPLSTVQQVLQAAEKLDKLAEVQHNLQGR
jgi:hypothetical protein